MKKDLLALTNKKQKKISVFSAVIVAVLVVYCLILISLLIWSFISSFKMPTDFNRDPFGLPTKWVTRNYDEAWTKFSLEISTASGNDFVYMPKMFFYGFLYAIGCSTAATLVPCIVGYLCAKYNYKFSKVIYFVVIVVMILPIVGNLPAEIKMARDLGLYDQIWGMWIMKANFLGMYFIVFYNFFKNLPNAYSEAARIDGAGNFRIMFRIILPLAMPLFFTVMLLTFITYWNDYQTPMIYLHTYPTIAYGMYYIGLNEMSTYTIPVKIASAFLILIPVLILFLIFHKKLLGNLTMGGIKG